VTDDVLEGWPLLSQEELRRCSVPPLCRHAVPPGQYRHKLALTDEGRFTCVHMENQLTELINWTDQAIDGELKWMTERQGRLWSHFTWYIASGFSFSPDRI